MCQVIPFTLPCCRRVYVSISKLPSCPNSWPKAKCPPELCIQVRGIEPEERSTGECWRCRADAAGKSDFEKEKLRPAIDSARVVIGLEELGIGGRRRVVEEGGHCWFCNAKGGCTECGAKEINLEEQPSHQHREETPTKRRHREARPEKDRATHKRIKAEKSEGTPSTPGFVYSLPRAPVSNSGYSLASRAMSGPSYPDPNSPMNWNTHSYGSPYTPNHMYDASSSYEAFAPQTYTPPNQQPIFTPPGSNPWQTDPVNPFTGYSDPNFVASHATGNISYLVDHREATHRPREEMHRSIDPDLLQPKSGPDLNSILVSSSQARWDNNSMEFQAGVPHLCLC
jgi:hypothetical protein